MKTTFRKIMVAIVAIFSLATPAISHAKTKEFKEFIVSQAKEWCKLGPAEQRLWFGKHHENFRIDCAEKAKQEDEFVRIIFNTLATLEWRMKNYGDQDAEHAIQSLRAMLGLGCYWDETSCVETTGYLDSESLFSDK